MSKRYSRQSFLGDHSETYLADTTIAVIGLCGGGSHVCQQLAHIGVGTIVLVDFDTVDESNLTRMVGSTPEDAESERKKTEVLQRLIQFINPKVNVVIAEVACS